MNKDRMFHVLVVGGMTLVGTTVPAACGGDSSTTTSQDAGQDTGFPSELPAFVDAGVHDATSDFPSELPVFVDSGVDASIKDAPEEFPSELPVQVDAGDQ
jgi:hypothetical protein